MPAPPTLTPSSSVSQVRLPATGSAANVAAELPLGIYANDNAFLSGAAAQVAYTYKSLAGNVVDIELTEGMVYSSYEAAVLEWSYLVNMHQSKNVLSNILGNETGSFDHLGELSGSDVPDDLSLRYPRFDFGYARRVANALAAEAGFGPEHIEFSASVDIVEGQQDYDLQGIIAESTDYSGSIQTAEGNKRILVQKVFFESAASTWRFYGYFAGGYGGYGAGFGYGGAYGGGVGGYGGGMGGGYNAIWEVLPTWHNRLQAMAYEDSLWVRTSHYSYELKGNNLRLFPIPRSLAPNKLWIQFTIPRNIWEEEDDLKTGIHGVNNLNTVPFANLPFTKINSLGKNWIRKYALALCKLQLSHARGKILELPIPEGGGGRVTLNHSQLREEGREEIKELREELTGDLGEVTYEKLIESDARLVKVASEVQKEVPLLIYRH